MRRSWWMLAVVVLCVLLVVAAALAQDQRGRGMMGGRRGEMGAGPTGPGRPGPAMIGRAMDRGALAVSSEGVYVLAGSKLLKYDHGLNLVAQAEIPMPERPGRMGGGPGEGFEPSEE